MASKVFGIRSMIAITFIIAISISFVVFFLVDKGSTSTIIIIILFYLTYAILCFKTVTLEAGEMTIRNILLPFRSRKFKLININKVNLFALGIRFSMERIEIFFKDGSSTIVEIAMLRSELRKLQKTLISQGIESNDFL